VDQVQGDPSAGADEFQAKNKDNCDLPNVAVIVLPPAQNLEVITVHIYLCCMGVLCTWVKLLAYLQIWAVNCTEMRLAAGLRPDPLGEL